MERKEFLKRAGVGGVLASFPTLSGAAWAHDDDNDDDGRRWRRKFYFVALSGTAAAVNQGESVAASGFGRFNPRGRRVDGSGEFIHFRGPEFGSLDNIITTGRWTATRLLSYEEVGTWGVGVSGIVTMRVNVDPCDGPVIRRATLKVVCNIGPAGLMTDPLQTEGWTLTLPDGTTFSPFMPNIGLTILTRPCREVD